MTIGTFTRGERTVLSDKLLGNRLGIANLLNNLEGVDYAQGNYSSARTYKEESLTLCRELEDQFGIARSLNGLGNAALSQEDYAFALACFEEGLTIHREGGNRRGIANMLNNLGSVDYAQSNYSSARACYEESLALYREIGDRRGISLSLDAFANLAARESRSEQFAVLWVAAETLREQMGTSRSSVERETYECEVAQVRQVLGEEAFSEAWTAGAGMMLEQAIDFALRPPTSEGPLSETALLNHKERLAPGDLVSM